MMHRGIPHAHLELIIGLDVQARQSHGGTGGSNGAWPTGAEKSPSSPHGPGEILHRVSPLRWAQYHNALGEFGPSPLTYPR